MPDNESFNLMLDPSIFLDEEMGEVSLVARRMEHVDRLV